MTGIIVPDFLTIADRLASLDWPITLGQFPPHATTLGWTPTKDPDEYDIHTPDEPQNVSIRYSSRDNNRINGLSFSLTPRGTTETENNDVFVEAVGLARHHWGDPYRIDPGHLASMGWRFPNNCLTEVNRLAWLYFYTPTGWYLY